MDIGSIFLILGLLVIVAVFISRPFFERKAPKGAQAGHEQSSLLAERDRLLDTLQELDFDYALGKIPEAEYPLQRAALVQQGAQILRDLDAYAAEAPSQAAEARLEAAIAARRVETAPQPAGGNGAAIRVVAASPDDNLEAHDRQPAPGAQREIQRVLPAMRQTRPEIRPLLPEVRRPDRMSGALICILDILSRTGLYPI